MKFVVYTVGTIICLNTNKRLNSQDKPEGFKMELETDELTEALAKFQELQDANPQNPAQNLLDENSDWDSKEMDEAIEKANSEKKEEVKEKPERSTDDK